VEPAHDAPCPLGRQAQQPHEERAHDEAGGRQRSRRDDQVDGEARQQGGRRMPQRPAALGQEEEKGDRAASEGEASQRLRFGRNVT
jgi:hypothetical protein